VGTSAFACKNVGAGSGTFKDAHCDTGESGGSYKHEPLPESSAEVTATNKETKNNTTEAEHATLKGVLGGITSEITCKIVHGHGSLQNNTGPPATVTGEGTIAYSECTMPKPVNAEGKERCKIKEPIEFAGKSTTTENGKEMGVNFSPKTGTTFVGLTFEEGPGGKCPVAGKKINVTGSAEATVGGTPEGTGATLVFTTAMTKGTKCETAEQTGLCLGGQSAEFSSTITFKQPSEAVVLTTG
jgi:hypothetical protein